MLAVAGLALKGPEPHINKANIRLAVNFQLRMSLHNIPGALVATGPAHAEWIGSTQDAVLAEEAGVLYSVLSLSMPLTTQYLANATEKLYVEDLGSKGLWADKELGIPVYNTEDGKEYFSGCWGFISLFFFVSGSGT